MDRVDPGQPAFARSLAIDRMCAPTTCLSLAPAKCDKLSSSDPARDGLALPGRQGIVTDDHSHVSRQPLQSAPEAVALALIGKQPEARQSEVAARHRSAYSARMSEAERLHDIQQRIAHAARLARRDPAEVTLIAVSKTHPAGTIVPMIDAGQIAFGENRVQEAEAKWPALRDAHPATKLHLVGQLQSNKAEAALRLFDSIHSVDRPSLVEALARAISKSERVSTLFVQVNVGDEPQKGGCATADLPALLAQARDAGLPVSGLMCVPPAGVEAAPYFALLAKLARDHGLRQLSMGMSDDYETAVMLGATHVRVGSALFGARG